MRYTGIQPQYFPRLHFFARILQADVFVIRDDAQFVRKHKYPDGKTGKSYQAHAPIKQAAGIHSIMVPTKHNGLLPIAATPISYDFNWSENHSKTLHLLYTKSLNFSHLFPEITEILHTQYTYLAQLNVTTILWGILHLLGMHHLTKNHLSIPYVVSKLEKQNVFRLRDIRLASQMKAATNNARKSEKIIALCQEIGANEDYCGETAVKAYMNQEVFKENGIKIIVQDWKCEEYPQLYTKQQGFIPNLSIIDLLMNASHDQAVTIIRGK